MIIDFIVKHSVPFFLVEQFIAFSFPTHNAIDLFSTTVLWLAVSLIIW